MYSIHHEVTAMEFTEKSLPCLSIDTIRPLGEDQAIQVFIPVEDATDEIVSPLSAPSPPSGPGSSNSQCTESAKRGSLSPSNSVSSFPQNHHSLSLNQICGSPLQRRLDAETFVQEVFVGVSAIACHRTPDPPPPWVRTFFSTRSTILIVQDR